MKSTHSYAGPKVGFADYILYAKPNIPVAVLEAKDNNHALGDGMQQGLRYAEMIDAPFVFSSNGDGFLEHDRTANRSQLARAHYESKASGTSASMRNVSQEVIRATPIPLPSLAEQIRIVAKVDQLMGILDRLQAKLLEAQQTQTGFVAAAVHHLDASITSTPERASRARSAEAQRKARRRTSARD